MILITFGTRAEYLKIEPLIKKLEDSNIKYFTLFTGQHKDLKVNNIHINLNMDYIVSNNRLDTIVGNILKYGDEIFNNNQFDFKYVLVQGDTTSALGVALSSFHHGKKVIHLEGGLRTYNKYNPYPEETNRRIVSSIADIHLCPTEISKENLINEKTEGDIYVVGNTSLDNLIEWLPKCKYTNKVLITMHRRENHHWIGEWFDKISQLGLLYPNIEFLIPLHPNPNVQKYKEKLKNVTILDSLSHSDLLNILVKCKLVITDSGGIQEESSFFNKKTLTCRKTTERPESLEQSNFLVETPSELLNIFDKHINDYSINYICPFGDGYSSEKIVKILKNYV